MTKRPSKPSSGTEQSTPRTKRTRGSGSARPTRPRAEPQAPSNVERSEDGIAAAVREADALLASAGARSGARASSRPKAPKAKDAKQKDSNDSKASKESKKTLESVANAHATPAPARGPSVAVSSEEVEARIRELEGRLDRMMEAASQGSLPDLPEDDDDQDAFAMLASEPTPLPKPAPSVPPPAPSRASYPPPPSSRALSPEAEPTAFDTARELLSTNYYLRKWGRLGMRNRSEEVDDFGYDPVYDTRVRPFIDFLYTTYFRVEASGVERVPEQGRCLLVANHSGTVPFDGLMIRSAVKREQPAARDVRWLAEDFIFHFPFLGSFTTRIGAVRACQENAERLLRQEALVAVFPEGMKGTGKLFRDRYRLQRFGRGGFVKLALRTKTPIVPVAVLGGEETQPLLARLDALGKPLGFPYFPITPTFPLLGPVGLAPAPTKWRIAFGEPIRFNEGPGSSDDELLISRLAEQVRGTIQDMVDELVRARKNVFLG